MKLILMCCIGVRFDARGRNGAQEIGNRIWLVRYRASIRYALNFAGRKAAYVIMEIKLVENNKVLVLVSREDLILFGIEPETLTPDSPALHSFLFKIMENVQRETGFDPRSGQVVVEARHDGRGLQLTISKLRGIGEKKQAAPKSRTEKKRTYPKLKQVNAMHSVYRFDCFENLCRALKNLEQETLKQSRLYAYDGNHYFVKRSFDESKHRDHFVLCEFCTAYGHGVFGKEFLAEHGTRIAAGNSLVSMAEGIKKL